MRNALPLAGILLLSACTDASSTTTLPATEPSSVTSTSTETTEKVTTSSEATTTEPPVTTEPIPTTEDESAVFEPFDVVAFGDAADCRDPAQEVASLAAGIPGEVLIVGDLAYPTGSQADFVNCFLPLYGAMLDRIHAVPGDNDYKTDDALPYFNTIGVEGAGNPGEGWWSFTRGAWQIIGINSKCSAVGFCGSNSPQYAYVKAAVEAEPAKCRFVMWHMPRFTSSESYDGLKNMSDLYQLLYDNGADILIAGNSHHYERFEQLGPDGAPDSNGIANFTLGTGGAPHTNFGDPLPGSAVRNNNTRGVTRFTLDDDSYTWEFIAADDGDLADSGTLSCNNR